MKRILVLLYIFGFLTGFVIETRAQSTIHSSAPIRQKTALGFYISSIVDEREGLDSISTVLSGSNKSSITYRIALQSSTLEGIAKILTVSNPSDTSLRPLRVRINVCQITETLTGSDRISGEVRLILAFDLEKENGAIPLTQYKSIARYSRSLTNLSVVEATLQGLLENSLKFITGWINTEEGRNPAFATGVELIISDYLEQHEDTVYYHQDRPLVWTDFREKRSESKFAAAVFPSFGYDQRMKVENGIIKVELVVKVYVVKSASWVGPGSPGNYGLRHEQKHFDLVKIVSERFKRKLIIEKLDPENYQGIINFEYLQFYREMNKIQKEYDEQTSHGTSVIMQEFWNRKIEAELNSFSSL